MYIGPEKVLLDYNSYLITFSQTPYLHFSSLYKKFGLRC